MTAIVPRRRRFEIVTQLLFGVPLARPLHCPRCRWTQTRASLATLTLLANDRKVRCVWCAKHMTQEPPK